MISTVDVQGFKIYDNRFIIKEIAVVLNEEEFHCFHIKAPFEYKDLSERDKRQSKWLALHHHNLSWDHGSDSFMTVKKYLSELLKNRKVYVKGEEKAMWIQEFLDKPILNVETISSYDVNISRLYNMYPNTLQCQYHDNNNGKSNNEPSK